MKSLFRKCLAITALCALCVSVANAQPWLVIQTGYTTNAINRVMSGTADGIFTNKLIYLLETNIITGDTVRMAFARANSNFTWAATLFISHSNHLQDHDVAISNLNYAFTNFAATNSPSIRSNGTFAGNFTNRTLALLHVRMTNTPAAALFDDRGTNIIPATTATNLPIELPIRWFITNNGGGFFYAP